MEEIKHNYVEVNGLKLHVAEIGSGWLLNPSAAVVFLHGFPEIWYSWRHQMIAVAKAGFRAIAPDYRGYGLSDPPPEPEKTTFADFIADVLTLLMLFPFPRVSGVITLGVPFIPPSKPKSHTHLPKHSYVVRWKEPGRAEAEFNRFDCKTILRNIYILFSGNEIPIAEENQEIMDMVDSSTPLPPWFTEEDLAVYSSLYEKSGFQTALQVPYRSIHEEFNIKNLRVKFQHYIGDHGWKGLFIKISWCEGLH